MNEDDHKESPDQLICCDDQDQVDTSREDCFTKWEREQRRISNDLTRTDALLGRAQARFDNAGSWEQKLKTYWEAIGKTEQLIGAVGQELTLFIDFTGKVCINMGYMVDATKILTCNVWQAHECTRDLKSEVTSIINDIKCLGKIPPTAPIMKSLTDLEKKLDEAQTALVKAITEVLKVLNLAIALNDSVCNECPDDCKDDPTCCQQGLKANLDKLNELVCNGPKSGSEPDLGPCKPRNTCNDIVPLSGTNYYEDTREEYAYAQAETTDARTKLNEARKRREELAAAKKGLDNAIKAASDARKS